MIRSILAALISLLFGGVARAEVRYDFLFLDECGNPRTYQASRKASSTAIQGSFSLPWSIVDWVEFEFEFLGEPAWELGGDVDPNGRVSLVLTEEQALRLGDALRVRIGFPGHPVIEELLPERWFAGGTKTYVLPTPEKIRLRVHFVGDRPVEDSFDERILLMTEPSEQLVHSNLPLSGFGSWAYVPSEEEYIDVDLPVLTGGEHWLLATGCAGGISEFRGPAASLLSKAGPYRPVHRRRDIVIERTNRSLQHSLDFCGSGPEGPHTLIDLRNSFGNRVRRGELTAGRIHSNHGDGRAFFDEQNWKEATVWTYTRSYRALAGQVLQRPDVKDALQLEPWQCVVLEMKGLTPLEQRLCRSPVLSQVHDGENYGFLNGQRLRDRGDGITRWRYRLNAGEWRATAPDLLFAGFDQALSVQDAKGEQTFVLEGLR